MEDRKIYIDKMASKLKEWDLEIQKLEEKADAAKSDIKTKYRQQIDELYGKKEEAQQKLNKVQQTSGDAWEELKRGAEQSMKILGDAVKNALSKFN